jgi:hypothetical protein
MFHRSKTDVQAMAAIVCSTPAGAQGNVALEEIIVTALRREHSSQQCMTWHPAKPPRAIHVEDRFIEAD